MARLIKLKNGTQSLGSYITYNISQSLSCGDGYKEGTSHRFEGTKEEVELLVKVLKKFKLCTVTDIKYSEKISSFVFSSENKRKQIFCWRICRYIRSKSIKKILIDALEINKIHKVIIPNAFVIAYRLNRPYLSYFTGNRDMFIGDCNYVHFGFRTHKEFIEFFDKPQTYTFGYSYIFIYDGHQCNVGEFNYKSSSRTQEERLDLGNKFKKLLNNKEYLKASKLISKRLP